MDGKRNANRRASFAWPERLFAAHAPVLRTNDRPNESNNAEKRGGIIAISQEFKAAVVRG
jgi:hypothetical protein